jgi:hypothetical protein
MLTDECKCLLDDPAARAVFLRWLEKDTKGARLSPTYRLYYRLRHAIPLGIRQAMQRSSRPASVQSDWYLPHSFYDELVGAVASARVDRPVIHPWPGGKPAALVLTHDIETEEGVRNVARIADLEEKLGLRSSWNFVAHKYKIDDSLLRDLRARSFEIGVHGHNHDGRLYESEAKFVQRAKSINRALKASHAVGFRSPMVHRNLEWLQRLEILYDASCFDIDPFQAMAGGVGSIWPFVCGRFVELPYTMPQDHTLFVRLAADGSIWRRKAAWLAKRSAMVLMLTHPDYLNSDRRISMYSEFLKWFIDNFDCWHATPSETAAWWRGRCGSNVREIDGTWRIDGPAEEEGSVARCEISDRRVVFQPVKQSRPPVEATYGNPDV